MRREPLLTVPEVAELMRVSQMTIYRMLKSGEIASVRVGRSYRVKEADVEAYLQQHYTGNDQYDPAT